MVIVTNKLQFVPFPKANKPKMNSSNKPTVTVQGGEIRQMPVLQPQVKTQQLITAKQFKCSLCQRSYSYQKTLNFHIKNIHMKTGNEVKEIKKENECKLCGLKAASKNSLVTHFSRAHGARNPYNCGYCTCRFKSALSLARHLTQMHKDKKAFQKCDFCPFKAKTRMVLKIHIKRLHVPPTPGIENFKCAICGYNYKTGKGLKSHMAKVHEMSLSGASEIKRKKQLTCLKCSKKFSRASHLNAHVSICPKRTRDVPNLNQIEGFLEVNEVCPMKHQSIENESEKHESPVSKQPKIKCIQRKSALKAMQAIHKLLVSKQNVIKWRLPRENKIEKKLFEIGNESIENPSYVHLERDNAHGQRDISSQSAQLELKQNNFQISSNFHDIPQEQSTNYVPWKKEEANHIPLGHIDQINSTKIENIPKLHSKSTPRTAAMKEFTRSTCLRCGLKFETKMKLKIHFTCCNAEANKFVCKICDKILSTLFQLKKHIFDSHLNLMEKIKCERIPQKEAGNGKTIPIIYMCYFCKAELESRKDHVYHMSVRHFYKCRKCPFFTKTIETLKEHNRSNHP